MILTFDNKVQVYQDDGSFFEYEFTIPKYIVVNKWDRSLFPIRVMMPKPPKIELIDNVSKSPSEQIFKKVEYPEKLRKLEESIKLKFRDEKSKGGRVEYSPQREIAKVWNELLSNARLYKEEIQWIKKQIYHLREGYWCMIDREVVYFPAWYYFYLNFWTIDDVKEVEFRFRDRDQFVFMEYLYTTDENEFYEHTGFRTFFGIVYPKHRRDGATHKGLSAMYSMLAFENYTDVVSGIQSHTGESADKLYRQKFVPGFSKLPFFLKLLWKGTGIPEHEIKFDVPNYLMPRESSGNSILPAESSDRQYYDSQKLFFYLGDEEGKCFGKNTMIRMFDGSTKPVQDVVEGDVIMGNDSTPRIAYGITNGKEEMFKIIPNKGEGFICNKSHILHLYASDNICINKIHYKSGDIINISVSDFIKSSNKVKKSVCIKRVGYELDGKSSFTKNRKDPQKSGFKIESIGYGDYYGFAVNGNHLFLLEDGTIVHNTVDSDIFDGWNIIKPIMSVANGAKIHGFAYHPSTVAEMEKRGGSAFMKLLEQSKFYERDSVLSQTKTGLARYFSTCINGMESFIDKFGRSVIDDPTEKDAWRLKEVRRDSSGKMVGARRVRTERINTLKRSGSQTDAETLIHETKLYPMEYLDCFGGLSGGVGFNTIKLNNKRDEITRMMMEQEYPCMKGDFVWEINGVEYTAENFINQDLHKIEGITDNAKVKFIPSQNGRFEVYRLPKENNQRVKKDGIWHPMYPDLYTHGIDSYQFYDKKDKNTAQEKKGSSDGGFATFMERDFIIDPQGTDVKDMKTNKFVVCYRNRPDNVYEFAEECLMCNIFYGGMAMIEMNVKTAYEHYINRGFKGYCMYLIRPDGKMKDEPGVYTGKLSKQEGFIELKTHIDHYIDNEYLMPIIHEWNSIRDIEEMTHYDLITATMCCLIGSKSKHRVEQKESKMEEFESYDGFYDMYDYQ